MSADADWDLVVVGAGPAGAAAALGALAARSSARVLILDAAGFPRDKVCGDGIAPHALDVLAGLGVDVAALVDGTEPVTGLRLRSPAGLEAARPMARPAHVVPRQLFDARLLAAAVAAGAEVRRHRVRQLRRHDDGVVVDDVIRARCVVGADGAESVVRRAVGLPAPRPGTVAIALRGYVEVGDWPAGEQFITMTARRWPAYAWVFPVGDGTANVGYGQLIHGGTAPTRAELTAGLQALVPSQLVPTDLRGHRLPLSAGRPELAHGPVLLAGDAASLINPMTGEGIYYAVQSGALAGAAALSDDPARTYRRGLRRALGAHLRQTDLLTRLNRRPAVLDIGVGAARDSATAFDALVDIGLGAGRAGPALLGSLARSGLRRWRGR